MGNPVHSDRLDVELVIESVIAEHRLTPAEQHNRSTSDLVADLVDQTPIP